jgi:hypothetical protein
MGGDVAPVARGREGAHARRNKILRGNLREAAKLGALLVDQHRIENVDANEAHLEALRELAAAPVMPPAPEPTPDPVVPPAAETPHILDITPESDDTVRH